MNNSLYFANFDTNSSAQEDVEIGEVCIANISPLERRKRMRFGITQFVISLVILGALLAFDANPLWRLLLILPFGAAAAGYFQATEKT